MAEIDTARRGIALIGMPGAGKSTVGALLAQRLGLAFIDTDALIEARAGLSLQQIVDSRGALALRDIEETVLLELAAAEAVVATGGSAVYSEAGMARLRRWAVIVYLDVASDELRRRLDNFATRGIARQAGQSFSDLYAERRGLYERYAELRVEATALSAAAIAARIEALVAIPPAAT